MDDLIVRQEVAETENLWSCLIWTTESRPKGLRSYHVIISQFEK